MIKNIGIDIVQNKRIKLTLQFYWKVLSESEIVYFLALENKSRQREYLAGRWAIKEAILKALDQNIIFNKITVLLGEDNKLHQLGIELPARTKIHLSLSHERDYTVAVAIVEFATNQI